METEQKVLVIEGCSNAGSPRGDVNYSVCLLTSALNEGWKVVHCVAPSVAQASNNGYCYIIGPTVYILERIVNKTKEQHGKD